MLDSERGDQGPGFAEIPMTPSDRLSCAQKAMAAELIAAELTGEPVTAGVQRRIESLRLYEEKAEEDLAMQF